MIKRDYLRLIVQHQYFAPHGDYGDGGDSASRCGIMALCGSTIDMLHLHFFALKQGMFVRHPIQAPWNNPRNFTRDQLIPLAAGIWSSMRHLPHRHGRSEWIREYFWKLAKRGFVCFNTEYDYVGTKKKFPDFPDILAPDQVGVLIIAGSIWQMYWTLPICFMWHLLAMVWNCTKGRNAEQNQFWCTTKIYSTTKLYLWMYGKENFKNHTMKYWGGWRDQKEIAEAIIGA